MKGASFFHELKGRIVRQVRYDKSEARYETEDEIIQIHFDCDNNITYTLTHYQDCCEHVYVSEIVGDMADIIGHPILLAEEVSSRDETPEGEALRFAQAFDLAFHNEESCTWTFYKLSTIKGSVTIRWVSSSSGYYSEEVSCVKETTKCSTPTS